MKLNIYEASPHRTHQGGPAIALTPEDELRRTVMACMLWEDSFYEDGQSVADRIMKLVPKVGFDAAAAIAIEAREKMKLRHVPLLVARACLTCYTGRKVGDLIARIVQRPDEAGELLAIYRATGGKSEPKQMRAGLGRALLKFDEYQLAKYKGAGSGYSLRDVVFLMHPRAGSDHEAGSRLARLVNKQYIPDEVCARYEGLDPTAVGLKSPETWENQLSRGENKREVFAGMIASGKLGAMAMLRNLRNMVESGVPDQLIRQGILGMKADRVLPFRFITAARHAVQYEGELEQAMFRCLEGQPKLRGKTVLLVDVSGSMTWALNTKSEMNRTDAACGLAMLLREVCESVRVFAFSDKIGELPPRRGFALRDAIANAPSGGTLLGAAVGHVNKIGYDRVIVITDEQSADAVPAPVGLGYMLNVAHYQNGVGYGPWVRTPKTCTQI